MLIQNWLLSPFLACTKPFYLFCEWRKPIRNILLSVHQLFDAEVTVLTISCFGQKKFRFEDWAFRHWRQYGQLEIYVSLCFDFTTLPPCRIYKIGTTETWLGGLLGYWRYDKGLVGNRSCIDELTRTSSGREQRHNGKRELKTFHWLKSCWAALASRIINGKFGTRYAWMTPKQLFPHCQSKPLLAAYIWMLLL